MSPPEAPPGEALSASRGRFEALVSFLGGDCAAALTHDELEARLQADGRELLRGLLQDHLDLRAARETRIEEGPDKDGVARAAVEPGHARSLV